MSEKIGLSGKTILVTGSPGFIGANLVMRLLKEMQAGTVISFDNMNDYYDPHLKEYRLKLIEDMAEESPADHIFIQGSIADKQLVSAVFSEHQPDIVVNLAAQAGVRYSITNPDAYMESNIIGFYNILEACRKSCESEPLDTQSQRKQKNKGVQHLVYASSSSVYGINMKIPYSTQDKADCPVSLYAATKRSDELLAHAYSKLYNIPMTGLRFFTVYGPAGRPDMAYFGFTDKMLRGEKIQIFNYGNCQRDFTYIDDIVEGVYRVMQTRPEAIDTEDGAGTAPCAVYNIGNGVPVNLRDFVDILKRELVAAEVLPEDFDLDAHMEFVSMQPGDVLITYADTSDFEREFEYKPSTSLMQGLRTFARWYKEYYQV